MSASDGTSKEGFAFTAKNARLAKDFVARYPPGRQASAVLPLLDLAQRQSGGWLPRSALDHVADLLSMPRIRVYEVATFYTMFNLEPVGRHLVQVCTTTPCWLCGSDDVLASCRDALGIDVGETSDDGKFTLVEAECLGACCNAPMMQINDDYYEDLDAESTRRVLEDLQQGKTPKTGSQTGRTTSEPITGLTTLVDRAPAGQGS
jgi:NADH-quinone oxidoreductase subunit E